MTTEECDDWVMGLLADLDAVRLPRPPRRRLRPLPLPKKRVRRRTPSSTVTKSNFGPPDSDVPEVTINVRCRRGLPRWEKRLPRSFTLAATPVEILGLKALLDSGASGLFPAHPLRARARHHYPDSLSAHPRQERRRYRECRRRITEVVDLVLRYNGHSERVVFAVTDLGEQDMILGYTWLKEHNPEIDWAAGTVSMSRCPARCQTCREEVKVERKARNKTRVAIRACCSSGVPAPEPELDDIPELYPDPDCEDDPPPEANPETDPVPDSREADTMEEGDRLLATALFGYPAAEEIRASQTTSQRLAEAFARNSTIFPDDDRPFRVEADSSDFATGAVLSQQSPEDEKWHPVAFYSKSLNAVERNYEIHDKEMLAIIRALEEWRHFLEGARHKVEVYTDHKNLQYFLTAKKLNRRQARWSLYLANFDFVLHHRPGRSMGKPDALSRRPDHGDGSTDNADIVLLKPEFFAVRAPQGLIAAGEEDKILRDIRRGNREGAQEDVVAKAAAALKSARSGVRSVRSAEWSEDQGILMFRGRIYVPNIPELRRRIVEQHHDSRVAGHPGRWKTLELVSRSYWWPQMSGTSAPTPAPATSANGRSHGCGGVRGQACALHPDAHHLHGYGRGKSLPQARVEAARAPDAFISDRGPQFVAEFTRELYRLLGIKLSTSTAYHPQSDGQTERVNQELEQYLRVFCNERQDDWMTSSQRRSSSTTTTSTPPPSSRCSCWTPGGTRAWALSLGR
ncbi:putative retrotransposable element tf2 155 kda protein type 1-like [Lyophyllum shimeji]|uniref:Retrotransposable element tf2 155 kDa protein type 1-like n=1 Tax=Lyophyllum shimeji TaxID=47721 RepID=A0A9P3PUH6_LYOSH|nr:putative retrotransposable element tf2 155 kda protein type 1-like [Lyophyllum shimeji]